MMPHTLVKHHRQHYECASCGQTWRSRPRTYPWLPTPIGCLYFGRGSSSVYVMLYDPNQAIKKRAIKRDRRTRCLSDIAWPLAWTFLLEETDRLHYASPGYSERLEEVADIAFHLTRFSSEEIEHIAGQTIRLIISPLLIHQTYSIFRQNRSIQSMLAARIRDAYRDQKAAL